MKGIRKFAQKHIYIFSFMIAFISIGLLLICNLWIFKTTRVDYNFNRLLAHLVPLVFIIAVCYILGNIEEIGFRKKGIGIGILLGWPIVADGIYGFVISYNSLDKSSISFPGVQKIIFLTLVMLIVGIFEEVLCRGVILNNMLTKWGYTKKCVIKSVILSSLIFALGHFVNLFDNSTPIVATGQVIYTFLFGILFASIYLRCKNIWSVAIVHAIFDWLQIVVDIFHPVAASLTQDHVSVASMLISSSLCIPFALIGFFLLRKVYVKDISQSVIDTKSV